MLACLHARMHVRMHMQMCVCVSVREREYMSTHACVKISMYVGTDTGRRSRRGTELSLRSPHSKASKSVHRAYTGFRTPLRELIQFLGFRGSEFRV